LWENKIRIMKVKPEITDEEIHSYMNFDALLAKYTQEKALKKNSNIVRNTVLALVALAVIGVWYFSISTKPGGKAEQSDPSNVQNEKISPDLIRHDTTQSFSQEEKIQKNENVKSLLPKNRSKENPARNTEVPATAKDTLAITKEKIDQQPAYVQAEPVEGYPALYEYFSRELKYPSDAMADSIQGVVLVVFNINKQGKRERISVEQSLGTAFDKEALRVVENMPEWKPATLNSKPVVSRISIPLTFQIKKLRTNK
jgi:TonB family protein